MEEKKEREREREITLLKSMLDGYGIFSRVSGRFQGRLLKNLQWILMRTDYIEGGFRKVRSAFHTQI